MFKSIKEMGINKVLIRSLFFLLGALAIGFAIGLNNLALLGNDPISVFYDGVSKFFNIDLGFAINIVNLSLILIVFIFGRKYIDIGLILYVIPLGWFTNLCIYLCSSIISLPISDIVCRIIMSIVGCFLLFLGIAIVISLDLGLDPWSGLVMIIKDKLNKSYKVIKVCSDAFFLVVGFLLGGTVGVVTVVAAFLGGPVIEFMSNIIKTKILKESKLN